MKYNNLLVIGDLNIDILSKKEYNENHFSDLCDSFSLKNLQLMFFCLIKIIVFHHTTVFESGLSDCYKMILAFFRAYFKKLPHKNIEYRILILILAKELRMVLDKDAAMESMKIKGNHGPFLSKELSKAIMNRSKLRNRYTK